MLTILTAGFLFATAHGLVPQVALCPQETCPTVSRIGMGALHLGDKIGGISDSEEINAWLKNGLEQGITLLDTADVYPVKGGRSGSSATLLGEALALTPGLRENFTIVSKTDIIMIPPSIDSSPEHLVQQVNWYLEALQTSYLDVLLLHFPDSFMDADAVASTFNDLKTQGLVRNFGTSNHYPSHRKLLQSRLDQYGITLVTNEIEVSVWNPSYMNYDSSLVDDSYTNGYRILGWGVLGGDPTGGFNRLFDRHGKRQTKIRHAMKKVGEDLGEDDESVIAVAWVLAHPSGVIPLIGTTKIDRFNNMMRSVDLAGKMTHAQWWSIGGAGGLCAMADSQCNYDLYNPNKSEDL